MSLKRARLASATAALAVVAAACSGFQSKPSVSVKEVPADLAFGAPRPTPTPSAAATPPLQTAAPSPAPGPALPSAPAAPASKPSPTAGCQPPNPFPSEPATSDISQRPNAGSYEFSYSRTSGKAVTKAVGTRRISGIRAETLGPQTVGFSYTVEDGFTGQRLVFVVRTDQAAMGFYLRAIGLPRNGEDFVVQPRPMVQILAFPLQPRATTSGRGADPLTGTVLSSMAEVQDRVADNDRVRACDGVADAWRVRWSISLTGSVTQTWNGTFWLATQWGGWPIADNVAMSGQLLSATVRSAVRLLAPRSKA